MTLVLIIEDDPNIRMFISVNLEARGYSVLEADTGVAGLQMLREQLPNVVVLDMVLPDVEGWDILNMMSEDEALKSIPVVLMTASVNSTDPLNRTFPNLVERLVKPVSVENLIEAVQRTLI